MITTTFVLWRKKPPPPQKKKKQKKQKNKQTNKNLPNMGIITNMADVLTEANMTSRVTCFPTLDPPASRVLPDFTTTQLSG